MGQTKKFRVPVLISTSACASTPGSTHCRRSVLFYVDILAKLSVGKALPDSMRRPDVCLNQRVSGQPQVESPHVVPQRGQKTGRFGNKHGGRDRLPVKRSREYGVLIEVELHRGADRLNHSCTS